MAELRVAELPAELVGFAAMLETIAVGYMDGADGVASPEIAVTSLAGIMLVVGGFLYEEHGDAWLEWADFAIELSGGAGGMVDQMREALEAVIPR